MDAEETGRLILEAQERHDAQGLLDETGMDLETFKAIAAVLADVGRSPGAKFMAAFEIGYRARQIVEEREKGKLIPFDEVADFREKWKAERDA